jgi:hypothetical protein
MNFFLLDALAYSTRFGGSLIITQLEIRTESQLAQENEFFSDRRLNPLYKVRGSLIFNQLEIRTESQLALEK